MNRLPSEYRIAPDVVRASAVKAPIVALETTVITHGLPYPENLALAEDMERIVRANGATPATIGVIKGLIHIGMNQDLFTELISAETVLKISRRDYALAISRKESGGTTVAGTLIAAHSAGIKVLATGGIGGVHRDTQFDVSTDLYELARTPLIVVCSGAKSILDLPATIELLETLGVPVIGYQTDHFPAFYARSSGLPVQVSVETPEEVSELADAHWRIGMKSAIMVVVPVPEKDALSDQKMEKAVEQALEEAQVKQVVGQRVTPFLLRRVSELTGQQSLRANLSLLLNNAKVASEIACAYHRGFGQKAA